MAHWPTHKAKAQARARRNSKDDRPPWQRSPVPRHSTDWLNRLDLKRFPRKETYR